MKLSRIIIIACFLYLVGVHTPAIGQNTEKSIEELFNNWFEDYNQGCSTDYLQAEYKYYPKGDARHPNAAKHVYFGDVFYGPYSRNVLDFWQVKSDSPTPVVIYIHGGGFISGSKDNIHRGGGKALEYYLSNGISVVSINYRLRCNDTEVAQRLKTPRGLGDGKPENGTRLDYIMRDCARAVQFIRYKAEEWNIYPELVAVYGGSAGGGSSMWIGTSPDMKNEKATDPVLRESTRITAAGHWASQVTYNWPRWPELLEMDSALIFSFFDDDIRLWQMSRKEMATKEGRKLGMVLDFYENMTSDDCPFVTCSDQKYLKPGEIKTKNEMVHHPYGSDVLFKKGQKLGLSCEIHTRNLNPAGGNKAMADFFIRIFHEKQKQ